MTLTPATPVPAVPLVPWGTFVARLDWRQGEHVALVGPTGQGKTTLALALVKLRDWRLILATKPRDATLDGLVRQGYVKVTDWPPPGMAARVILWPKWRTPADTPRQAAAIRGALFGVFRSGGWGVFADDVQYLTDVLRLGAVLNMLWLQARALNVSVMAATQRPRWVPRQMWTQSTHVFIWGTRDQDDLRALSGMNGADTTTVRRIVAELPRFHALYVNTRTGAMVVTKAPPPRAAGRG